jgi:hypothetical protein
VSFYSCNSLTQQLIQNLQATNMSMMAGRHSRSLPDLLTTARVLRLVDEFPVCSLVIHSDR